MFETIRISPCNDAVLHPLVNRLIAVALLATLSSSTAPAVWAAPFENSDSGKALSASPNVPQESQDLASSFAAPFKHSDIAKALSASPNVPQESQDLASSFIDHTLPRLLTDDDRLAQQLGFGDSMNNPVIVDRALSLMLIHRNDVAAFVTGISKPLDLINNTNNWMKDQAGRLVPNRIVFSLKVNNSTSEAESYFWSSVTLEKSRKGSWRIIQLGAPNLSRAISLYETPQTNHFLLWVPDLNRRYLGEIRANSADAANPSIILTALFNDPLAHRRAGERFDITSKEFIEHLLHLYQDLDLPKKLYGQSHIQKPIQTKK